MEDTGRFLKYDPVTKAVTVLIPRLMFPNGVTVSKDGTFVLIAESGTSRFNSCLEILIGTTYTGLLYHVNIALSHTLMKFCVAHCIALLHLLFSLRYKEDWYWLQRDILYFLNGICVSAL